MVISTHVFKLHIACQGVLDRNELVCWSDKWRVSEHAAWSPPFVLHFKDDFGGVLKLIVIVKLVMVRRMSHGHHAMRQHPVAHRAMMPHHHAWRQAMQVHRRRVLLHDLAALLVHFVVIHLRLDHGANDGAKGHACLRREVPVVGMRAKLVRIVHHLVAMTMRMHHVMALMGAMVDEMPAMDGAMTVDWTMTIDEVSMYGAMMHLRLMVHGGMAI